MPAGPDQAPVLDRAGAGQDPPILFRSARVVTVAGPRPRRGAAARDLSVLPRGDVLVVGDRIAAVAPAIDTPAGSRVVEARGRVLMPAFIDCHTHACFAGERVDEWEERLRGATYLDILKAGGGIMSTVRATRAATHDALAGSLVERLNTMLALGTATVEVKTGYGLSPVSELAMLRAIRSAAAIVAGTVVPTALLGHAIDPGLPRDEFVRRTIAETLPRVVAEHPGIAVDAYVEEGAWTVAEALRLFDAAAALSCPVRAHADQFNQLGLVAEQVRRGAAGRPWTFRTLDHLEATDPSMLAALAGTGVIAVGLPCSGFHTDGRYARLRAFIDAGGAAAIATNLNPGSAPCPSLPMAAALAVRSCGLTPAEAISAITVNAAEALGLADRGQVVPGQRADLVLLRHADERAISYEFGTSPVAAVFAGGRLVSGTA